MSAAAPPSPPAGRSPGPFAEFAKTLFAVGTGFSLPLLGCIGLMLAGAVSLQVLSMGATSRRASDTGFGPAVAVIRVEGAIVSASPGPFGADGVAAADDLVAHIRAAGENPDVKAILLHVNSPGGGVTASDLIYHALPPVDKPIVVLMGDVAASGGYYISMAADWIIANPNTLTGSIGVISEFPNAEGLLEKVGVEFVVITAGARKDVGSPYREMTEAERAYWQAIVDETHAEFIKIVAAGRGLAAAEVGPLADGSVYTGRQALTLKLIDALGYEADALAKAAELGGITGDPRVIEYEDQPTFFELLSQAARRPSLVPTWAELANLLGHPRLNARWIGP